MIKLEGNCIEKVMTIILMTKDNHGFFYIYFFPFKKATLERKAWTIQYVNGILCHISFIYCTAAGLKKYVVIDLTESVHVAFIKHPHRIDQMKMYNYHGAPKDGNRSGETVL